MRTKLAKAVCGSLLISPHDPGVCEKAYRVINLDDVMLAVWRQMIAGTVAE